LSSTITDLPIGEALEGTSSHLHRAAGGVGAGHGRGTGPGDGIHPDIRGSAEPLPHDSEP